MNADFSAPHRLCVRNVDYRTRMEELMFLFSGVGAVRDLYYPKDKSRHNRGKGFAFVTMADAETAERARLALDGRELRGRKIQVVAATPRQQET